MKTSENFELLCDFCKKKQAVYVVRFAVINLKNDETKGETICLCDACAKMLKFKLDLNTQMVLA